MEIIGFVFIMIFFGGIIGFLAYDTVANYYYGEDEDDCETIYYEMPVENNKNDNQPIFFNVG